MALLSFNFNAFMSALAIKWWRNGADEERKRWILFSSDRFQQSPELIIINDVDIFQMIGIIKMMLSS